MTQHNELIGDNMLTTFNNVLNDHAFTCNGTKYLKVSSRTAKVIEAPSRWFYFKNDQLVDTYFVQYPLVHDFDGTIDRRYRIAEQATMYHLTFCDEFVAACRHPIDCITQARIMRDNGHKL